MSDITGLDIDEGDLDGFTVTDDLTALGFSDLYGYDEGDEEGVLSEGKGLAWLSDPIEGGQWIVVDIEENE